MPQYWILKTEPSEYAFADLQRDGRTRWDGISNALALKHLRSMHRGDEAMVYHTGDEKRVVGLAKVVSEPDARAVVELELGPALPTPVSLATIKADPAFKDLALVRMSRLSVVPVPPEMWRKLLGMAGAR
ncbi:MAG: EVE domain-containing protein [Gemmatimonadales bacterium]